MKNEANRINETDKTNQVDETNRIEETNQIDENELVELTKAKLAFSDLKPLKQIDLSKSRPPNTTSVENILKK